MCGHGHPHRVEVVAPVFISGEGEYKVHSSVDVINVFPMNVDGLAELRRLMVEEIKKRPPLDKA